MGNRILHLTLKKKWFDMILSGVKKEEYREVKAYWSVRFINESSFLPQFKKYDIIRFTNGYSPNSPSFDIECKGITIGLGKKEWGAPVPEQTFIISLGNILSRKNC